MSTDILLCIKAPFGVVNKMIRLRHQFNLFLNHVLFDCKVCKPLVMCSYPTASNDYYFLKKDQTILDPTYC